MSKSTIHLCWRIAVTLTMLTALAVFRSAGASNANTGPVLSTTSLRQPISLDALAVDTITSRFFVATADIDVLPSGAHGQSHSHISIFDSRMGTLLQVKELGTGLPVLALDQRSGHVFVADSSLTRHGEGVIYMLDAATGSVLGSNSFSGIPLSIGLDTRTEHVFVVSEKTYVCMSRSCSRNHDAVHVFDTIRMFDARTLQPLQVGPVGPAARSIMIDERSRRVFVTGSHGVDILDAATGRVVGAMGGILAVLAVDQRAHHVVVVDNNARVHLRDDVTGRGGGTVSFRGTPLLSQLGGVPAAVDDLTGNVFILDSGRRTIAGPLVRPGGVSVIDGVNGRIVHTVQVGRMGSSPSAITVDPNYHQAFIADMFTDSVSVVDTQHWHVQRTIAVGSSPLYLVFDRRTGHLIVESIGASVVTGQRSSTTQALPVASITVLDMRHQ